jgi:hypothetical protein
MSKFLCKCGNVIGTSGAIPNPNEYLFISDVAYDAYQGKIGAEELYDNMKRVSVCDSCGRLWVYINGLNNPPKLYQPEDY